MKTFDVIVDAFLLHGIDNQDFIGQPYDYDLAKKPRRSAKEDAVHFRPVIDFHFKNYPELFHLFLPLPGAARRFLPNPTRLSRRVPIRQISLRPSANWP